MIKKIFLAVITAFIMNYSYADWSGEYIYKHGITMANEDKLYRVDGQEDSLTLKKRDAQTWDFELFVIARSANMCDLSGVAKQISSEFLKYTGSDECTLKFRKENNQIHVKDVGEDCGCGHGVYLDNLIFSPKPQKVLKARQATPLRKISDGAFKKINSKWKGAIMNSYIYRSQFFHNVELDKFDWYQTKVKTNKYSLFSDQQPYLIILDHEKNERWQLINIWKIDLLESTQDGNWKMYPAIYPISDDQDAIALTSSLTESYSGGDATFDLAKIIPLESSKSILDASSAIIQAMPFSCSKLVRACFSEEETNKFDQADGTNRCHDVGSGYLTLKTQRSSIDRNWFYDWSLTWNERFLEGLSATPEKTTIKRVTVDLNSKKRTSCQTFDVFDFCGGGQEDYCLLAEPEFGEGD